MKITRLTTYHAAPRWLFLKVETDEGITGWGEPVIEGRARSVEAAVHELAGYVIGKDPARINDLWQTMYRAGFYRGGAILMSAIAGIDQALWDIKGKALGVPVYELLGGLVRDRMKTYRWVGGDRPGAIIQQITDYRALGFDTFKFNGTEEMKLIDSARAVDAAVVKVAEIREAFGNSIDFGIDFHGRVGAPMAKALLRELEPFKPLFVEEPVLAEQAEYYPRLAASTSIPLAAGERMFSRFEFKNVLCAGGIGMVQPDLSHAGGITECVKIAAMAEAYDVASPRTARSARSRWPPACTWTSFRTTRCCRNRASASTTTKAPTCSITSSIKTIFSVSMAVSPRCPSPGSVWRSTKTCSSAQTKIRRTGATRSGVTAMAASPNGEHARTHRRAGGRQPLHAWRRRAVVRAT
ncbi:hypothetical protein XPN_4024 [Xanthomonas arboricola pv. pruni MAFF 301427]|nr:hypothetical protein XPN_4024 [Xanthomonas arboricola pv. pruni MAFF 301427]